MVKGQFYCYIIMFSKSTFWPLFNTVSGTEGGGLGGPKKYNLSLLFPFVSCIIG